LSVTSTTTERTVDVAGLQVHINEGGSGSPLVLLHHSTGPLLTPFIDRITESFAVVAPDLPGYGQSERPVMARSARDIAVLMVQLLDTLELEHVQLVGLGFGGWIAAEMATMAQRHLDGLTLVGAAGIRPHEGYIDDPMMSGWIDYARRSFKDDESFEREFGAEPAAELVDVWDRSREMTARLTWKPWMWSGSLPTTLAGVRIPVLLVWGRHDRIVPLDCAEQYADILPDARLEIVEDAGHVVDLEQPDTLARLVADFAAATTAGR
jgi:pimeloyl-ACP methyl ester carboxylesterase